MNKKAYFVSDLHFGANYPKAYPNREKLFCQFLDGIYNQASHLFILGDLFEFWMEYEHFIPKRHFELLTKLKSLSENNIEIHYLSGNHDFNLGTFFTTYINMNTYPDSLSIKIQGKNLFLFHGDGIAKSDWKYRIVKKILQSNLANYLFKLIHPDWGMNLASKVGKTSRNLGHKNKKTEYEEGGYKFLQDADVVIHGHTHRFFIKEVEDGIYINSGEWLKKLQYIELEEGRFSLKEYQT